METIIQDLKYGFRSLSKSLGFTSAAVLALALGVGANTAIFSVINGVLLRPLPYPQPESVVSVFQHDTKTGVERSPVSLANFLDYRERAQSFSGMAALRPYGFDSTGEGEPETFHSWLVTEDFFDVMGVAALHGRVPAREEFRAGHEAVVVLSHGLWRRRFGGDPSVVGRKLTLDGNPYTVVGVMPPEFHLMEKRGMVAPFVFGEADARRRGASFLTVVGRLKPNVSVGAARGELKGIAERLAQEHPQTNREMGATVVGLSEQMLGGVRPMLLVLLGAVGLVLLIACANVASLLLARGAERGRELAIRAALGAGRARLARQLLTESVIIASLGGALGVLLAWWGIDMILALSPGNLPRAEHVSLSLPVLGFATALSLATALVFGLIPSLQFSKPDLNEALREGGRTASAGAGRHRLRRGLVVAEIALALVLLVGAGLLVRSFARLLRVDPGFSPENTLALQVHVYDQYPKAEQQAAFFEEVLGRVSALLGVRAAGGSSAPPFVGEGSIEIESDFTVEGRPAPQPGQEPSAQHTIVTSDYFRAAGVPLRRGRQFEKADDADSVPVVIVNETFARRYFPGEDAVGKRIVVKRLTEPVAREIVGVVGDVRHTGLDGEPTPELFMHTLQVPFGSMTFVVRTEGPPLALLPAVKREVWSVNRGLPFYSVATMEQLVADTLKGRRFSLALLGTFAVLALALAAVGIYGLISFSTSRRAHEIGVRMALGAQAGDILKMIVGEGLLLGLAGVALGAAGAFALTRFMAGLLFGVTPADPPTYAAVAALLLLIALLASYIPARRATKVDPMAALRYE
jgi:putative ABC transport system permease protein